MRLKQDRIPSTPVGQDQSHSPTASTCHSCSPPTSKRRLSSSQRVRTDSETEEAAQALEDIALGRRQYLALGLNAEVPVAKIPPTKSVSTFHLPLAPLL
jgi:hypothetical protein